MGDSADERAANAGANGGGGGGGGGTVAVAGCHAVVTELLLEYLLGKQLLGDIPLEGKQPPTFQILFRKHGDDAFVRRIHRRYRRTRMALREQVKQNVRQRVSIESVIAKRRRDSGEAALKDAVAQLERAVAALREENADVEARLAAARTDMAALQRRASETAAAARDNAEAVAGGVQLNNVGAVLGVLAEIEYDGSSRP